MGGADAEVHAGEGKKESRCVFLMKLSESLPCSRTPHLSGEELRGEPLLLHIQKSQVVQYLIRTLPLKEDTPGRTSLNTLEGLYIPSGLGISQVPLQVPLVPLQPGPGQAIENEWMDG